ncbi:MAG TPA: sialidase family protein [Terriglobales bacterium]|nr:sialidase family protein [Terriglobales bacterium]
MTFSKALLRNCLLAFSLLLVLSQAATLHSQELPTAPGSSVSALTPEPGYFTEPGIAINPRNPEQVVAVFQDNAHAAYSTDSGNHWQVATGVESTRYRVSGDVSVVFDTHGHAIICYMAFDKLGTYDYWGHNSSRNGLYVRRSLDGGKTWEANDIPIIAHDSSEQNPPWEDKPYIVSDTTKGKYAGNLYVGWTRWTLQDSQILFTRSTDGGDTWSKPIEIDTHRGLPRDDNGSLEGFDGVVAPDGALYVVWNDGNDMMLAISRDGGESFDKPHKIVQTAPIMFKVQDVARANGFPQIALAPKAGKHGRLYVTWSDYRNGDVDVFCATSDDEGRSWSAPVRVNDDPQHNGADQYFQWMAVDPATGDAYVLFYDRRNAERNEQQTMTLARSTDGGHSFKNYAWTTEPFRAYEAFMGDYTGLAALNGRVYGVWTEKPPLTATDPAARAAEARRPRNTLIKVGVADFGSAQ